MKAFSTVALLSLLLFTFSLQSCVSKVVETKQATIKVEENNDLAQPAANSQSELKKEILKIIAAFEQKDENTLNNYVDQQNGVYLIPGPGTLLHFERLDRIDFENAYLSYHQFGKADKEKYKFKYETLPTYDCENYIWSKHGLFVASDYGSILTGILNSPQNAMYDKVYSDEEIKTITAIDQKTKAVILTKKDSDISFGIARINGKYVITYVDIHESYCDV